MKKQKTKKTTWQDRFTRAHWHAFIKERRGKQAGFTLLLAAIAASIALSLGSAIFTISSKEVQLSAIGRDSQYAFYAADTAAECALYWDVRFGYFGTSSMPDPQSQYVCDGQQLKAPDGSDPNLQRPASTNPAPYPYTISIRFEPNGHCSNLYVTKCDGPISATGVCTSQNGAIRTVVRADGFNTNCANISAISALQRSVELSY